LHAVPRYRKHLAPGQAIVTISGQCHYFGPHGSRASKVEYDRLIAEWPANDRQPILPEVDRGAITVTELVARYGRWAQQHYRRGGRPTKTLVRIKNALRPLRRLYGHTPAAEFGPVP
jgi:hypothetical protein